MPIISTDDSDLYVSADELRQVLAPEGANDQSTAAQFSDNALIEQIRAAQAEVNARLSDRYTVPFDLPDVPRLAAEITRDIAAYLVTLTHRRAGDLDESDAIRLRYTRASALLVALGSGEIDLDSPPADVEAAVAEPTVVNPYEGDLFAREDMAVETFLT